MQIMAKYELSKEWIRENGYKIKEAYLLITDPKNKYDTTSTSDVLEIMKIVDPENATNENAEIFSKVLQLFTKQMESKFKIRRKQKSTIIN